MEGFERSRPGAPDSEGCVTEMPEPMTVLRASVAVALLALGAGPAASTGAATGAAGGTGAVAPVEPLTLAVARAAADDDDLAAFYRARDFAPVWLGAAAADRRAALLAALEDAGLHGLPAAPFDADALRARFRASRGAAEQGALEVEATALLLRYARAVGTGVVEPASIDPTIVLAPPERDWPAELARFADGDPWAAVAGFAPQAPGYRSLMRERLRLEEAGAAGGWGPPVPPGDTLRPGDAGPRVAALRARLAAMGHLRRSPLARFDAEMTAALRAFQADHGLVPDGRAGPATLAALNVPLEDRLGQVIVNLERRRWMNKPLEPRHVLVNIAEQRAYVVDDGVATFDTVVVVGSPAPDRRTPEFSDTMTHVVVNPSWHVPRSIAVEEYLPALQRGGARHLEVRSSRGRVNPAAVDFSQYTARTFPFTLRQPPGPSNALGQVKFMFPNRWNIYLHDTPAKSLFDETVRAFSHGCVRVGRPAELAAHLLALQEADPRGAFDALVRAGAERRVDLVRPIGVHLVYWSAWVTPDGRPRFRGDPYGRDEALARALRAAGVAGLDGTAGRG